MLKLRFIGSGNAFNDGGRLNQCICVEIASKPVILIDCGPGIPGILREIYSDQGLNSTGYLLLTHFHGDHSAGVPFFLLNSKYMSRRKDKFTIIGPDGTENHVKGLNKLCYPVALEDPGFPIEFIELDPSMEIRINNGTEFQVAPLPVEHRPESLGYRITVDNKTIAITGDTSWTESLVELGSNADIYIMECNDFTRTGPHLSYEEIFANKDRIGAKRIILNHLGITMLDNLDRVEFETASDDLVIEL